MKTKNWGIVVALASFFILNIFWTQCGKSQDKRTEYRGILVEIYYDKDNRNSKTYRIQTSEGILKQTARTYPGSFDYIELGDSIIKEKGQLQITIQKKKYNFSRMASFSYDN